MPGEIPSDERVTRSDLGALWAKMYEEQVRLREELRRLEEEQKRGERGARDHEHEHEREHDREHAQEHEPAHARAHERGHRFAKARAWATTHRRATAAVGVALVVVVLAVALFVRWMHSFESTDDAQIDGDISSIGARVAGTVAHVYVEDNQYVTAGQLLVELDPTDYRLAVEQAEANVAQAEAQAKAQEPSVPITKTTNATTIATTGGDVTTSAAELAAAQRDDESAAARLAQSEAQNKLAQTERERAKRLVASGSLPPQELDRANAAADAAAAELASAQAAVQAAQAHIAQQRARVEQASTKAEEAQKTAPEQLAVTRATVASRQAQAKIARAMLERAKLDLGYTQIRAPVAGVVGRKGVNVGDRVQQGQQLLALVQIDHQWVTANFKETQLARMAPGQRARVSVDAYGVTYDAVVDSLPGASGAKYSLFPPENATGNYVKVVQRLPVRLRLLEGQPGLERLRPGMSAEPKVFLP